MMKSNLIRRTQPWIAGCAAVLAFAATPAVQAHEVPLAIGKTWVLDGHALSLGDGRVSAQPKTGHVFSCQTRFMGGGAFRAGDWITGLNWDETRKIFVQGDVAWPMAEFAVTLAAPRRMLSGNALPLGSSTGTFPVQRSDPAFQVDRNPNTITARRLEISIPSLPEAAAQPSCVPMGIIGVMLNGVALFNALDGEGRDAVAHEVQDHCNGHPERSGQYHYHGNSNCVTGATGNNTLVGYALDGFGVYSMFDAAGKELTNADLDECHGRTSKVMWDGKEVVMYHYVVTREYPYSVGCFKGIPTQTVGSGRPRPPGFF
jgi:hypothetical protein